MPTVFPGETPEAAARSAFVQQACVLAASVLLLYETCQTADLELVYIWGRGRAAMIILFVTIRHLQLTSFILNAISYAFSSSSPQICTTVNLVSSINVVIPYFGWAVFLTWRSYALSSRNAFIGLVVFICSASFAAPSIMEIAGRTISYTETPPSCNSSWNWPGGPFLAGRLVTASRPANLLAEIIVLTLTCRKTFSTWFSRKGRRASLPVVLYENGVLCFLAGTVLHILNTTLTFLPNIQDDTIATASTFRDALIAIFLSRFILELARIGAHANDTSRGVEERGVLTTEWIGNVSDVPSQWTLDEEHNGRGFDKVETFELGKSTIHDTTGQP